MAELVVGNASKGRTGSVGGTCPVHQLMQCLGKCEADPNSGRGYSTVTCPLLRPGLPSDRSRFYGSSFHFR